MIDEKKIEEAAEKYSSNKYEQASFLDGATWVLEEILKSTKSK